MRILEKQVISIILIMCLLCSYIAPLISVAVDTEANENEISLVEEFKSKLYENYYSDKANDFKYVVKKNINISNQSNIVQVKLEDDVDSLLLGEDKIYLDNTIYYNFCLISVKSFNNIFGKDGLITFFDNYGNEVGAIKADMSKSEDEYYIFKFERKYDKISCTISKPVNEGTLELIVQKTMKSSVTSRISYEDLRNIQNLVSNTKISYQFTEVENTENEDAEESEKEIDGEGINIEGKEKVVFVASRSDALDVEQDEEDADLEQEEDLNNEENELLEDEEILEGEDVEVGSEEQPKEETKESEEAQQEVIKETEQQDITDLVELKEPTTQIDLSLSEDTIYTLDENKVEFTLVLKNSSYANELFKDPVIDIGLPEEITDAQIDKVLVLYKNGLSISKWEVIERENTKHIYLELDGEQTEYLNSEIIDGTTIIVETTLKTSETTPIKESNVKLRYENSDRKIDYKEEEKDSKDYELNFMSKYGLLLLNGIENESKEDSKKLAIGDNLKTIDLDIEAESQKLKYDMTVVNNYTESLKNVEIIGSLPVENNEKLLEQDLKNTFTSDLLTTIGTAGVENTVYYSNESNPSKDSNSWTENYEELESIASYKIVMNEFNAGDVLNFNYESSIPEDLTYNQAIYSQYNVNYNLDGIDYVATSTVGAKTETKEITYEDCQTQESVGALDVGIYASKGGKQLEEGQEVHEGQYIDYTVVLTNNTDDVIENIELESSLVNGNFYELRILTQEEVPTGNVEEQDFTLYWENEDKKNENQIIEKLEPNEQAIYNVQARIRNKEENEDNTINANYILKIDGEEYNFSSIKNVIKPSSMNITVAYGGTENVTSCSGNPLKIGIHIDNNSIEDISNCIFEFYAYKDFIIDEEFTQEFTDNFEITNKKESGEFNIYEFKISDLNEGESKDILFIGTSEVLELNKMKENYYFICNGYDNNEEYISNYYERTIYQVYTDLDYEFKSNPENNSKVEDGEEVNYTLEVKNIGQLKANANIIIVIPYGLVIKEYSVDDEIIENSDFEINKINFSKDLESNQVLRLDIKGKIDLKQLMYNQDSINMYAEICSMYMENNKITNEIVYYVDNPNKLPENNEIFDDDFIENLEENQVIDESLSIEELEEIDKELKIDAVEDSTTDSTNIDNDSNLSEESKKDNEENTISNNTKNETVKVTYTNTANVDSTTINTNNSTSDKSNKANQSTTGSNSTEISKGTNNIKGTVWIDTNRDGLKDSTEKLQQGITVKLYKTSELSTTENYIFKTTTNNKGEYEFNSLEDGTYIVVFEFDTDKYTITQYSVNSTELGNSNVISKTINNKEYAVSNSIILGASNTININFGLAERANFDLKIDKKISSVKIENGKDDRTTNYNNESLVKEEITAKYLAGTKVTITYNIKITNIGDIAGYANEIKDYLPESLEFKEDLNKDWTLNNGELVNSSLTNTEIKPGESKELKLVLTKTMTEDNTGTVTNKAGITVNSNSKKVQDANNKNDISEISIILSVKTGGAIIISAIVLVVLAIFGAGVWLIKFKVMR